MERDSEMKASLEFVGVATNASNFYYSKATYKGSEGCEALKGGLAPESLSSDILAPESDIYKDSVLKQPLNFKTTFSRFGSRKSLKRNLRGFGNTAHSSFKPTCSRLGSRFSAEASFEL